MTMHFFLLSGPLSTERLSWIEESLKFFFVQLYPETFVQRGRAESPVFSFFITGDALYSLEDPESLQIWEIILSLSAIRITCDRQEIDLRGISIERLRLKFPDLVIDQNGLAANGRPSFWKDVAIGVRERSPLPEGAGWFQTASPYMYRSAWHAVEFLTEALATNVPVELYTYLDGIHTGHAGQNPTEAENIGRDLCEIADRAGHLGLACQMLACNRCATARGYSTWDDGKGVVISTCVIKPFRIRDLDVMVERFGHNHVILAENAASIQFPKRGPAPSFDRAEKSSTAPPVTILVTRSPYSTEHAYGAIAFAVACAHRGILTRVIFLEDGVHALTGTHRTPGDSALFNIQELINAVAGNENLHFFVLMPSLQKRGIAKSRGLNAVLEIGYPGLGKILFYPPANVQAEHQRVLVF
jgi:tRNA 2-thiouridine synthesizing protein C